jgi:hypothetical protein
MAEFYQIKARRMAADTTDGDENLLAGHVENYRR